VVGRYKHFFRMAHMYSLPFAALLADGGSSHGLVSDWPLLSLMDRHAARVRARAEKINRR
jgi:hypothetical protein